MTNTKATPCSEEQCTGGFREESVTGITRTLSDVQRDLARADDVPSVRELRACAAVCEDIVRAWPRRAPDAKERGAVVRQLNALRAATGRGAA